jgi:hypothetical protein
MAEFNRRELLSGLVATLAVGGVAASADVIEAEPAPLLLVLKSDKSLNQEQHAAIRRHYDTMREQDSRLPLLVVLEPVMALEAVLDPRAYTGRVVSVKNGDQGTHAKRAAESTAVHIEANRQSAVRRNRARLRHRLGEREGSRDS